MLPFREFIKTQSDKKYTPKRTKLHHIFKKFSGKLAYAPKPPSIYMHAPIINMYLCMKVAIFYSRLFLQNRHQKHQS